jgi:hypothetical protein
MQATVKTFHRGNLALQSETFTLPLALAVEVVKVLDTRPGTYWESALKATRRAKRAKESVVKLHTAGFGSSDLHGAIAQAGGTVVSE